MTSGLELGALFYEGSVAPLLGGRTHAAALLGDGSEVLGFDDVVSTDHDFGPRVQIFVSSQGEVELVERQLEALPTEFNGWAVGYVDADHHRGALVHHVEVTTANRFFSGRLGFDPVTEVALGDWLRAPTQILATLTAGAVFHDPTGELNRRRRQLDWYPDDVWRYALAAGWLRVSHEEPFVARTGSTGDDVGSRVIAARVARDLMRLAFLIERRWAPYSKWLGRAFSHLRLAERTGPLLSNALAADRWEPRQAALNQAGSALIEATNELALCRSVDPTPRPFHDRDITVVAGERLTVALTDAITNPVVLGLMRGLGSRYETDIHSHIGRLVGTIDQACDSTDVLTNLSRFRAASDLLGLDPTEP